VPDDEAIIVSNNKGRPVVMENGSLSGQAYRNIARRLTGEEVPFLNLEEDNSFIKRLTKLFKTS
jgi:septum site-determining protein MinD